MTIGELRRLLEHLPKGINDNTPVLVASDEEGNDISPMHQLTVENARDLPSSEDYGLKGNVVVLWPI